MSIILDKFNEKILKGSKLIFTKTTRNKTIINEYYKNDNYYILKIITYKKPNNPKYILFDEQDFEPIFKKYIWATRIMDKDLSPELICYYTEDLKHIKRFTSLFIETYYKYLENENYGFKLKTKNIYDYRRSNIEVKLYTDYSMYENNLNIDNIYKYIENNRPNYQIYKENNKNNIYYYDIINKCFVLISFRYNVDGSISNFKEIILDDDKKLIDKLLEFNWRYAYNSSNHSINITQSDRSSLSAFIYFYYNVQENNVKYNIYYADNNSLNLRLNNIIIIFHSSKNNIKNDMISDQEEIIKNQYKFNDLSEIPSNFKFLKANDAKNNFYYQNLNDLSEVLIVVSTSNTQYLEYKYYGILIDYEIYLKMEFCIKDSTIYFYYDKNKPKYMIYPFIHIKNINVIFNSNQFKRFYKYILFLDNESLYNQNKDKAVDHIDRNPLNNKLSNLRYVSITENNRNRNANSNSESGKIGVYFDKRRNIWVGIRSIMISKNPKKIKYRQIGASTIEEAMHYRKILTLIPDNEFLSDIHTGFLYEKYKNQQGTRI